MSALRDLIVQANPRAMVSGHIAAEDIFLGRVLDSYAIIQLVVLIENQYGIVFDFNDLNREHFHTLDALERLLQTKYQLSLG